MFLFSFFPPLIEHTDVAVVDRFPIRGLDNSEQAELDRLLTARSCFLRTHLTVFGSTGRKLLPLYARGNGKLIRGKLCYGNRILSIYNYTQG